MSDRRPVIFLARRLPIRAQDDQCSGEYGRVQIVRFGVLWRLQLLSHEEREQLLAYDGSDWPHLAAVIAAGMVVSVLSPVNRPCLTDSGPLRGWSQ